MKNYAKLARFNNENNEVATQNEEQQVENKSTWQKIKKPVIITVAVAAVGAGVYGLYKVGKKALTKKAEQDPDFEDPEKKEDK